MAGIFVALLITKVVGCFKKQQSVDFNIEHANVDPIAMKPLPDEQQQNKPDSQGFTTIDLDDKDECTGTNTSKLPETGAPSSTPSAIQSPSNSSPDSSLARIPLQTDQKRQEKVQTDKTGQNGQEVQADKTGQNMDKGQADKTGQDGKTLQADKTGQEEDKGHQHVGNTANDKAYSEEDEKAAQTEDTSKKADEVNTVTDKEVNKEVNKWPDSAPQETLDTKASSSEAKT